MLVCGSKLYSQTCDRIIVFETTVAGVAHQVFEQRELARPQVDRLPAARHAPRQQVQHQVVDRQRRRLGRARRAADQRLHAREQLGERERLGQVVVAAGLQAADAVVDRPPRAQNQHRRRDAAPAQLLDERQAVALGQHQVDDRDVVRLLGRRGQPRLAVGRVIHREARLAQPATTNSAIVASSSTSSARTRASAGLKGRAHPDERPASFSGRIRAKTPRPRTVRDGLRPFPWPLPSARASLAAPRAGTAAATGRRCPSFARRVQRPVRIAQHLAREQHAVGLPSRMIPSACAGSVIRPDGAGRDARVAADPLRRTAPDSRGRSGSSRRARRRPTSSRRDRRRARAAAAPAPPTARCPSRRPSSRSPRSSRTPAAARATRARTASTTSRHSRTRLSNDPPYSSVRVFTSGERNS